MLRGRQSPNHRTGAGRTLGIRGNADNDFRRFRRSRTMSVGYTRRWTYDPGNSVLTQIEGVDILDRAPPQSINGVGSGAVNIVGEFENGPLNVTTEVTSATQLGSVFGGFGYVYNGVVGQNPCARQRAAD